MFSKEQMRAREEHIQTNPCPLYIDTHTHTIADARSCSPDCPQIYNPPASSFLAYWLTVPQPMITFTNSTLLAFYFVLRECGYTAETGP